MIDCLSVCAGLEKKLKKELKATRDLLADALDKVEEMKGRRENKSEMKELRDKVGFDWFIFIIDYDWLL